MPRFATTIESPLDLEEVWARVADVTRFAEWHPSVLDAEQVSGDGPGPTAAYELVVRAVRGPHRVRYDVNEYAPPNRLFLVADTGAVRSEDELVIEAAGAGSELTYRAELRYGGFYAVVNPFVSVPFKVIGWRAGRGLRRLLDGDG